MTVRITKPEINVREKLAKLDKPSGIAGEAMLRAETPQEQFNLIGAGRRNLIINGDMRIDQRNSGTAISALNSNNLYPLDRWLINQSSEYTTASLVTAGQNLDSLTPPAGFDKYIGVKVINATTAPSVPFLSIRQIIESSNITQLDYGKSTAKDISVSFWARTNHTGVYAFTIRGGSTQTSIATEFTIDIANTWQYISLTIPGQTNTATTWASDDATGFVANIGLGSWKGTYASTVKDQWVTGGFTGTTTQNQTFAQTNGNAFYVTGFQLELGKVATPFEHRSYGEELALCQRYYYRQNVVANQALMIGNSLNTTSAYMTMALPQPLRATPTVSQSGFSNYRQRGGGVNVTSTVTLGTPHYTIGNSVLEVDMTVTSGLPNTVQTMVYTSTSNAGYIEVSAEL